MIFATESVACASFNACAAICDTDEPIVLVIVITVPQVGPPKQAPLRNTSTTGEVVFTDSVGTLLVRFHVLAVPVRSSSLLTAVTRPFTVVLLDSVAFAAVTGPPAPRAGAVSVTLPEPASITPGVSVPVEVTVMPLVPV